MNKTSAIIKRGYKKIPGPAVKKKREIKEFSDYKYPIDQLRRPKQGLFDSMAVCEYTHANMGKINSYIRSVISVRFSDRKFSLRKQKVKNKERVVVYRIK